MSQRTPSAELLRDVVDKARLAPSFHNIQPWAWRITRTGELELWADRSRTLPVTDPVGRNLVVGCGTAVHHAVVAARAFGHDSAVRHLPDPARPDLLAVIELTEAEPRPGDERFLEAIELRRTDRRRFTTWPVPDARLHDLATAGRLWGAHVDPVLDAPARLRVEMLVEDAHHQQSADRGIRAEQERWLHSLGDGGIPRSAVPALHGSAGERPNRFGVPYNEQAERPFAEATDGLLVLHTEADDPAAWLHVGEALSAMWLSATLTGLSLVPLSQVVEVEATRRQVDSIALHGSGHTQLLARIGWQEIGRTTLERTPRRSLEDVLLDPHRADGPRRTSAHRSPTSDSVPPQRSTGPGPTGTKDHSTR